MSEHATGTFEVDLQLQALADSNADAALGRLSISKQFYGDLTATSRGEMLSAGTSVENSAGHVAIEKVAGVLHGREGSFVLQHSGTMTRGEGQLSVSVVPDSGTDELARLAGTMTIHIEAGEHRYRLEYSLATGAEVA